MANTQGRQSNKDDRSPTGRGGSRGQGETSPPISPGQTIPGVGGGTATTSGETTSGTGRSAFGGGAKSSTIGGNEITGAGTSGTTGGAATATARSFIDQAKETAGQAYEAVSEKAATKLDEQKSTLSEGLATVADSVRQVGDNLGTAPTDSGLAGSAAKYTQTAAEKLEEVARYFNNQSVRGMARDLEGFARRNPAVFLGAAFGLGLLAARFLKSSPPRFDETAAGREFGASAGAGGQLNTKTTPGTDRTDTAINAL